MNPITRTTAAKSARHLADPGPLKTAWLVTRAFASSKSACRVAFWPRDRIESLRERRVRETILRAYDTTPYYRDLMDRVGLRPHDIESAGDLKRLPVVADTELRDGPLRFLSGRCPPERAYLLKSSSSAGVAKSIYHDAESLLMNLAYSERQEQIYGSFLERRARHRQLSVITKGGTTQVVHDAYQRLLRPLKRLGPRRAGFYIYTPFDEQVRIINEFKPEVISGIARGAAEIYAQARRRGIELHRPRLFVLGAEALPDDLRRLIEEDYGIPVLMTYQANESLKIGYECERRRGYHLHEDLCHVRVVDEEGRDVAEGETGRLAITNLINRATHLINFDIGDRGRFIEGACGCGRTFRRLELAAVRPIPLLRKPAGGIAHYEDVNTYLKLRHKEMKFLQVVVDRPDIWRLAIVSDAPDVTRAWMEDEAMALQREVAGPEISIQPELVERPLVSAGGKTLKVIIHCWDQRPYSDSLEHQQ